MRISTSSFGSDLYQLTIERMFRLIAPIEISYDDLIQKAYELYDMSPDFVKRVLDNMERLGVIVYQSKLITLVPRNMKRNMRRAYLSLRR